MKTYSLFFLLSLAGLYSCNETSEDIELPKDIRNPSQEDLDLWNESLSLLTNWEGNLLIDGNLVEDYTAFDRLKSVQGSLILTNLNKNFKGSFSSLEEVLGDSVTGDGFYIETLDLDSIDFPNLKRVCTSLSISNSVGLLATNFDALEEVKGGVFIIDNKQLNYLSFSKLQTTAAWVTQRNGAEILLDNIRLIEEIPLYFNMQENRFVMANGSFHNLEVVRQNLDIELDSGGHDFSWLSNLARAGQVTVRGQFQFEDLCVLKDFVRSSQDNNLLMSSDLEGVASATWINDNCD